MAVLQMRGSHKHGGKTIRVLDLITRRPFARMPVLRIVAFFMDRVETLPPSDRKGDMP